MATGRRRWLWRAMPLVRPRRGPRRLRRPRLRAAAASPVLSVVALPHRRTRRPARPSCSPAVYHADVIAHRTGEPYGTLVLTVAVTVIEVALILSIMLAGEGRPDAGARDRVLGHHGGVQRRRRALPDPGRPALWRAGLPACRATSAYLVVLMPLATLALILPTYTTSVPGPFYTPTHSWRFVAHGDARRYTACSSTSRRCDTANYFLSDLVGGASDDHATPPGPRQFWESVDAAGGRPHRRGAAGQGRRGLARGHGRRRSARRSKPSACWSRLLVLLPETVAALRAARRNELQKSLNLALGSSLATIGLDHPRRQPARDPAGSAARARHRPARHRPAGADLRRSAW